MNTYYLMAALLIFLTNLGHFTVGRRRYLHTMMKVDFDPIAKQTLRAVFHYVSVFLLLSFVAILGAGLRIWPIAVADGLGVFIAYNYIGFALWQIGIALRSGVGIVKMFQWIFFLAIGSLCLIAL